MSATKQIGNGDATRDRNLESKEQLSTMTLPFRNIANQVLTLLEYILNSDSDK